MTYSSIVTFECIINGSCLCINFTYVLLPKSCMLRTKERKTNITSFNDVIIIDINLLMSSLLGYRSRLWIYPQGERAKTNHAGPVRIASEEYSRDQRLKVPKHGGACDSKFLVTHPMTNQCCLAFTIVCQAH
jgi:hypothetical protein